jgi:hypothetical protein
MAYFLERPGMPRTEGGQLLKRGEGFVMLLQVSLANGLAIEGIRIRRVAGKLRDRRLVGFADLAGLQQCLGRTAFFLGHS